MSRAANQRIQVPDDLREVLLEFTISYLLEQPADVVNYAADYFNRLRESRTSIQSAPVQRSSVDGEGVPTSPDESVISNEEELEQQENVVEATNEQQDSSNGSITTANPPPVEA